MSGFNASLHRIAAQHGVFLRREAIAQGYDDKAIRRAVRHGHWVRVRHGAYTATDLWDAADGPGRLVIRTHAALRAATGEVAASHHSAAAMHGMDLWDVDLNTVHLTRLDGSAGRTEAGAVHHEGFCGIDDVMMLGGRKVQMPVRAALETAAWEGVEQGLVVVNSGLHQGLFDRDALQRQHERMRRWPGSQRLQLVVRLADARCESVGESRTLYLCFAHAIPRPQLQYEVLSAQGELLGITDFAWPDAGLLGEFDGRVKYARYLRPGETPGDAVFREKRREDRIRAATGWRFVRLTWAHLKEPARTAAYIRELLRQAA